MSCLFLLYSLQSFSLYPMYVSLCQYASTIHNHQLVSSSFWVHRHTNRSWCRPSLIHTFFCCPVTFCSLLLHYTTTVIINTCYSFLVFKLSCKCLKCIDFFTFIFCFLNNLLFLRIIVTSFVQWWFDLSSSEDKDSIPVHYRSSSFYTRSCWPSVMQILHLFNLFTLQRSILQL